MSRTEGTLVDFASQLNFVDFSNASFRPTDVTLAQHREMMRHSVMYRPRIFQRNGIRWIATHAWRSGAKERGLLALKEAKRHLDPALILDAAEPIAALIRQLVGAIPAQAVTCIPCGHSRRPNCFGKQIARCVAEALGVSFVQVFADRPCAGSSHPRRSAKLPPLEQIGKVPNSLIVVDDIATSGRHLEETILALRQLGAAASAFAWISGSSGGMSLMEADPASRGRKRRARPDETLGPHVESMLVRMPIQTSHAENTIMSPPLTRFRTFD